MPPKTKRKSGYNWRARQPPSEVRDRGSRRGESGTERDDPNAFVLAPKPKKSLNLTGEAGSKRKRLGCKQKKRLIKIVEAKEKKAKVNSK